MTPADLAQEWQYRFNERMGLLTDGRPVSPEDQQMFERMASEEADTVVQTLKENHESAFNPGAE